MKPICSAQNDLEVIVTDLEVKKFTEIGGVKGGFKATLHPLFFTSF